MQNNLHKQMAEKLAVEVICSDGDEWDGTEQDGQLFSKTLIF